MTTTSEAWDRVRAEGGFTITIRLNETETSNMAGWVNKGFDEPEFANYPWRLVLEERTRARFEALAKQFTDAKLCNYPPGWGSTPTPAPPPVNQAPCSMYDITVDVPWGDFHRYETRLMGGFGSIDMGNSGTYDNHIVVRFAVPDMPGPISRVGYFSLAEFDGNPWPRHLTLSSSPCDFRNVDPTGVNGPLTSSMGKQVTIYFEIGSKANPEPGKLIPGHTYYMNVRNFEPTLGHSNLAPLQLVNAGFSFIWPTE